jgi:hypothetical protein
MAIDDAEQGACLGAPVSSRHRPCPRAHPHLSSCHGRASTAKTPGLADPRHGSATKARNPCPENAGASGGPPLLQSGAREVDQSGSDWGEELRRSVHVRPQGRHFQHRPCLRTRQRHSGTTRTGARRQRGSHAHAGRGRPRYRSRRRPGWRKRSSAGRTPGHAPDAVHSQRRGPAPAPSAFAVG